MVAAVSSPDKRVVRWLDRITGRRKRRDSISPHTVLGRSIILLFDIKGDQEKITLFLS